MNNSHIIPFDKTRELVKDPKIFANKFLRYSNNEERPLICMLRVPSSISKNSKIFICIHGITRNPVEQLINFSGFAESNNAILITPFFDKKNWHGYQKVENISTKQRADLALINLVEEIKDRLHLESAPWKLFGYSGGGQFAHRFAFAHPNKIDAVASVAAGWYSFPDVDIKYPLGIGESDDYHLNIDKEKILDLRYLVAVGEKDIKTDSSLNQADEIVALQGKNRLERGLRWAKHLNKVAKLHGKEPIAHFQTLRKSGHAFSQCMNKGSMGHIVTSFLFDETHTCDTSIQTRPNLTLQNAMKGAS